MPDLNSSPPGDRSRDARRVLKETTALQFGVGVVVAIAAVGLTRGGRDTWFGLALILCGVIFALRTSRLAVDSLQHEEEHEQQAQRERDKLRKLVQSSNPPPEPAPARPRKRRRSGPWSRR